VWGRESYVRVFNNSTYTFILTPNETKTIAFDCIYIYKEFILNTIYILFIFM